MSLDNHCVGIPTLTFLTTVVQALSYNYTNNVLITVPNSMSHPPIDKKIKNILMTYGTNGTPPMATNLCTCNSTTATMSFCKQGRS